MSVFILSISHTPALGKGPALRAALEEHTKASNAAGGRYSLHQRLYGSEPGFVNNMQFEGLAALDAYRASGPRDAARMARIGKLNEYLAAQQSSRLSEVLVGGAAATPPAYILQVEFTPAIGKNAELRKALEEQVKTPRKATLGAVLRGDVAPESGANFTALFLFADLAGFEEFRVGNQSDPAFATWQSKLAGLISTQPRQQLRAVLVPYPSR